MTKTRYTAYRLILSIEIHVFILVTALLTSLWLHLETVHLPPVEATGKYLFDDAFYYLQVARNIADGQGVTFDGVNVTNGFHPLWMLILTLLFRIAGANPDVVLVNAITLCALFNILTAFMIYVLIRQLFNFRWAALLGGLFWAYNFDIVHLALGGMETALSALMVCLCMSYYIAVRADMHKRHALGLGVLAGLTFLARVDNLILVGAIALEQLYWYRHQIRQHLRGWLIAAAAMAVVTAPWFIWSYSSSHALLPNSGSSLSYWQRYWHVGLFDPFNLLVTLKSAAIGINEYFSLFDLGLFSRFVKYELFGVNIIPVIAAILAMIITSYFIFKRYRTHYSRVTFMIVYMVGMFTAYSIQLAPNIRYMYPTLVVTIVVCSTLFELIAREIHSKSAYRDWLARSGARSTGVIYLGVVAFAAVNLWQQDCINQFCLHRTMYEQGVDWIKQHTLPGDVIGSFNAGIYGYFSERRVINLDGVINDSAYRAIRNHELCTYIEQENIRYLMDWGEGQIRFFLDNFGGSPNCTVRLEHVAHIAETNPAFSNWAIDIFSVQDRST